MDIGKSTTINGLEGCAPAYFLWKSFAKQQDNFCIITASEQAAQNLVDELEFFSSAPEYILHFKDLDILPYYGLQPSPFLIADRIACLHQIQNIDRKEKKVIVTSVTAIQKYLFPPQALDQHSHLLALGIEESPEQIYRKCLDAGYQDAPIVEDLGQISKRGDLIDIYSAQYENPIRLEFFGDEIESIRFFSTENQRSSESIEEALILPAHEILFDSESIKKALRSFHRLADDLDIPKPQRNSVSEALKENYLPKSAFTFLDIFYEKKSTFFDYLKINFKIFELEHKRCLDKWDSHQNSIQQAYENSTTLERVIPIDRIIQNESYSNILTQHQVIQINNLDQQNENNIEYIKTENHLILSQVLKNRQRDENLLKPLKDEIKKWQSYDCQILITTSSETQLLRLEDLLEHLDISCSRLNSFKKLKNLANHPKTSIALTIASINQGFVYLDEKFVILSDSEIFEKISQRSRKKSPASAKKSSSRSSSRSSKKSSDAFKNQSELKPGEAIIHRDHGVALYKNLVTLKLDGSNSDYLHLEYADGDKLYLPVYRMDLLSNYIVKEGSSIRLDKLGSKTWEKTVKRAKKAIQILAGELIKLYAQRAELPGFTFPESGTLMEEFEAHFPYEETVDQLKAIQEVTSDMQSPKAMDRLICGDVGFGKTEVAMRAAYLAVLAKKQVSIIVPTTVLAQQHHESFKNRFAKQGITIAMLSRFVSPKQQRETIDKLSQGLIDIVVGTHRLISNDIQFKDLGLLVIDEEHRFGVKQKEKIKQFKKQIDVISMTATPIPRSLNMSLSSLRDLSIINTAPADRLAVRTFVAEFNPALIQEAIHRELKRGGQVYFLHNKVQTIYSMADQLKQLLPEAKICVGHGQMKESELEQVMLSFVKQEYNILVCSTIIETGLDVANANTIIINRADKLGLAQLYQLRGRVGRSALRAYAYLLTPENQKLNKDARTRLEVLQRYTELGSGFKIAAHDMEIRGVGNLLGSEQSGHIANIGFDLYSQLLEAAIQELKFGKEDLAPETELKLRLSTHISEEYIPESSQRLRVYQRFSMTQSLEEVEDLAEELKDRFGNYDENIQNLILMMRLQVLAKQCWIRMIRRETRRFVLSFDSKTPIQPEQLQQVIQRDSSRFKWLNPLDLAMSFKEGKEDLAFDSLQKFLISLQ